MTKRITNLQLLAIAGIVGSLLVFFCLSATLTPSQRAMSYIGLLIGGGLLWLGAGQLEKSLGQESIWRREVSNGVASVIMNTVMLASFGVVGLMAYAMIKDRGAAHAALVLSALVVFGIGIGQALRRRFSPRHLVSYSVGFLIALIPALIVALTL